LADALCRPPGFGRDESTGLTALEDQHLGGAIMLLVGGVSYLLGGLWLTMGLLRDLESAPETSR
jgi:putative membrane protein